MNYDNYDIIVVGAGHAGVEAALAGARLGNKVLLLTMNLDSISLLACNPSIGGTGKGHLVREIDAMGGEMGLVTDKVTLQSKMLNTAKGPAVHSLRVQADKNKYHQEMKKVLEEEENLDLRQAEVTQLLIEDKKVLGVKAVGLEFKARAVILATGTYLRSLCFIGDAVLDSGPSGLYNSKKLSEDLENHGFALRRFKTGTPARIHGKFVNYNKLIPQWGDEKIVPFSFMNDSLVFDEFPCFLGYSNTTTHQIIQENIHLSAMYSGNISGTGARYCPSIEDKITRFAGKERHQLFLEPEGADTCELYVQGMSSSLPERVQEEFLSSIEGFEKVKIMRPGYAIEYDCIDPTVLELSLESREIENLFFAGQINGSSGYEEAAAQGLLAGINADLKLKGKDPLILHRDQAYMGVLVDDLVTKGTDEPFRMMTSRAEYRLVLRQDNADFRLTSIGYDLGLVSRQRYERMQKRKEAFEREMQRLEEIVPLAEVNAYFEKRGLGLLHSSPKIITLLRRSDMTYKDLANLNLTDECPEDVQTMVEIEVKYKGYIDKQMRQVEQFRNLEDKLLPKDIDYLIIDNLRIEARQKLQAAKPSSIGQASRISGVSPADITVLLIYLEKRRRSEKTPSQA